jgi:hypothetical protein
MSLPLFRNSKFFFPVLVVNLVNFYMEVRGRFQCDQIGRVFAYGQLFTLGRLLFIIETFQILEPLNPAEKMCINFGKK